MLGQNRFRYDGAPTAGRTSRKTVVMRWIVRMIRCRIRKSWQSVSNRVGNLADFGPPPVEPQYVFSADASAIPIGKPKAGPRYRWRYFLFADWRGVRFFSAKEVFVS